MNWQRVWLKLRWDPPTRLAHRALDRWHARRARQRRRARWSSPRAIQPAELPAEFSPAPAERLWPGACDRSWLAAAAERWPVEQAAASSVAEAAARGRFDLLGSGWVDVRRPDGGLRWHDDFRGGASFPADCLYLDVPICLGQPGTDIKVPWELSRFQHVFAFLWTQPERYREAFLHHWQDWEATNPVARGVNWACTMDVALRAISWTAALAAWGRTLDAPTLRQLGAALATHGHFIRENLEWIFGARTNHYFSDIVGLAVLAAVLAPYPPAREWGEFAAREMEREVRAQFAPDGFNREGSTTYHRLMVELATLGACACRASGRALGAPTMERLRAAYGALAALADAAGNVPLIGDNDSSRVFALAPRPDEHVGWLLPLGAAILGDSELTGADTTPEVALLCGPRTLEQYRAGGRRTALGAALPDSGFFILGPPASRLIVRCGPLTYRRSGWHTHLDQLSISLSVGGHPVLVDPGQYCYTPHPEVALEYRTTSAHNSLVIDGQPECRVFVLGHGQYTLIDEARPQCERWEVTPETVQFVGRHRGFRRLAGGADLRRRVRFERAARQWVVADELDLRGRHNLEWRFHLHPAVTVKGEDGVWRLGSDGGCVLLRWLGPSPPRGEVVTGRYAPAYGRQTPTRVLCFHQAWDGPVRESFVLQVQDPS